MFGITASDTIAGVDGAIRDAFTSVAVFASGASDIGARVNGGNNGLADTVNTVSADTRAWVVGVALEGLVLALRGAEAVWGFASGARVNRVAVVGAVVTTAVARVAEVRAVAVGLVAASARVDGLVANAANTVRASGVGSVGGTDSARVVSRRRGRLAMAGTHSGRRGQGQKASFLRAAAAARRARAQRYKGQARRFSPPKTSQHHHHNINQPLP